MRVISASLPSSHSVSVHVHVSVHVRVVGAPRPGGVWTGIHSRVEIRGQLLDGGFSCAWTQRQSPCQSQQAEAGSKCFSFLQCLG